MANTHKTYLIDMPYPQSIKGKISSIKVLYRYLETRYPDIYDSKFPFVLNFNKADIELFLTVERVHEVEEILFDMYFRNRTGFIFQLDSGTDVEWLREHIKTKMTFMEVSVQPDFKFRPIDMNSERLS